MTMILVTGGTGIVGSHLLYELVQQKEVVRATYRSKSTLEKVRHVFSYYIENHQELFEQVEWVQADINDIPALQKAFKNITTVYHCAAMVSFEPQKFKQLKKINIEGTANVVNIALTKGIKKLCYVSSVAALGSEIDAEMMINENSPWNNELDHNVYAISKHGAEMEVWRAIQEGLNAVIINPGLILGPGFWDGESSGQLFKLIKEGMRYYTTGISGYVDVWDVVKAMVKLMHSDISSERFTLVSENISFKHFQKEVAKQLNVKPPKKKASTTLLEVAWRIDWLRFQLFGGYRKLSKQTARTANSINKYDNSKIKEVLNFEFTPVRESIKKVCQYYQKDLKN